MNLSAIIVDDEKPARDLIREYLNSYPQIKILSDCEDGKSAIRTINRLKPDFIFLDIQMPECDGFEVLEHLEEIPAVIFCTAYEKYALKAFEVCAIDYLLKPYDKIRFDQAVHRLIDRDVESTEMTDKMLTLLKGIQKEQTYALKLFIKQKNKVLPLDVSEIEWIEALDDYSQIHTKNGSYLSGQNLKYLESLLNPEMFIRFHRSSLVNLKFIKEVRRSQNGNYVLRVLSGKELSVGRSRAEQLKKWMV